MNIPRMRTVRLCWDRSHGEIEGQGDPPTVAAAAAGPGPGEAAVYGGVAANAPLSRQSVTR